MTNKSHTAISTIAIALTCAVAVGCGDGGDDTPREDTGSRAEALTGEVEQAREQPTGNVADHNIEGLLEAYAEIDYAIGDAGMPCDLDPWAFDAAGDCAVSTDGDAVDVSCMSSGAASGTAEVSVHVSDGETYVHYDYDEVCAADRDVCVSGEGAVKVSSTGDVVVAGELTTTRDGETSELKYGVTVSPLDVEVVLWLDGESFVVRTGPEGVDIDGANGEFDCSLEGELTDFDAAIAGSCSGAASFDF
jgi:hypothetical protein